MEIPKTYDPKGTEDKWYSHWLKYEFFRSVPDEREPYTIVIPPPNVTGVLHMGHMLNNTIQDVLIRRARMMGKNACWVPGTDHASIATEAKVVAMLKEKGISKTDLTREEFLKYAWEWKNKYGGIILKQLEKLGASCDWERTSFTMDENLSEAVIDVFIDLYNKGQIYRGVRMVNWDPQGKTAVSDEEVNYKEVNSKLYYVKYKIEGTADEWITIATTRPETILGDTAVCVHPDDERYKRLKGKCAIVPIVNRSVPIIFDEYIDMEFGTGALKVTPAHDINDYNLGVKHKLEVIDTIGADGKMSPAAQFYVGEDRFAVRKKIAKDLEEMGQIVKVEDIKNKVGYSERTDAVIEPKLSMQWFLKMDQISKPALENVLNGNIKLIPDKFINTYKHWMENVHDWCISRQLWWGQRIPAWYDDKGNFVVAKTHEEALKLYRQQTTNNQQQTLKQDEDVVDTWFSSWLWPISVFDPKVFGSDKNYKGNADVNYYYPTNDLVTAPEILFFWVARMIIAGYEYRGEKPFTNVYLTGIVRDKIGRKMSKSLGNSPDPIELMEKYGADGVRVGMLLCSPAGNDLPFDEAYCEQGRNFSNKIWNAFRLIKGWSTNDTKQSETNKISVEWFEARFNEQLAIINNLYSKYRISEALMTTYKLVWDDFCSWYLEMVKPDFIEGKALPIDKETYGATIVFFEKILKVLHPFMPFITEEIWHLIGERKEKECIIVAEWPKAVDANAQMLDEFDVVMQVIGNVRNLRKQKNISPKESLEIYEKDNKDVHITKYDALICRMCNLSSFNYTKEKIDNSFSFIVRTMEFFVPLSKSINVGEERERLMKDLEYNKGFLQSVMKKLANERFVQNAKPEVIAIEKKKQSDAEAKIKALEEQLAALK
ncbi:MAG TPA: valine--tRNA ligase [Bacteroidia bacterium]|jgi:valyl-tRNA synthetase